MSEKIELDDECEFCARAAIASKEMGKAIDRAVFYGVEPVQPPPALAAKP